MIKEGVIMKKINVIKSIIILLIALIALACAAINLNISLNMLEDEED